jgi:hypothetical protein
MAKRKREKYKQWSTKYYKDNHRLSNMNLTKTMTLTQMFRKGK